MSLESRRRLGNGINIWEGVKGSGKMRGRVGAKARAIDQERGSKGGDTETESEDRKVAAEEEKRTMNRN